MQILVLCTYRKKQPIKYLNLNELILLARYQTLNSKIETKKLDILVVGGSKPTKKKINKAKELKIQIINEKDWYKMLNIWTWNFKIS